MVRSTTTFCLASPVPIFVVLSLLLFLSRGVAQELQVPAPISIPPSTNWYVCFLSSVFCLCCARLEDALVLT